MSETTPLSQRDPQWASVKHGTSSSTIGATGCTITGLCYILNHYGYKETPATVNKKLTDNKGYSQGNLVIWTVIPKIWPKLQFLTRGYSYDNAKVAANLPALVEVRGDRIGAPGGKHWVVFIGNQQMMDPWTGSLKATNWFGEPTGYAIFKGDPVSDVPEEKRYTESQMTDMRLQRDANYKLAKENEELASKLSAQLDTFKHDLTLANEKVDELEHTIAAERQATQFAKDKLTQFVDKCADMVGSPHDEESVVKFLSNYGKVFDELDELKVKYQKEKDQHAAEMAQTSQKLSDLAEQVDKMEQRHELEKAEMERQHKDEITKLKQQIKNLQTEIQVTKTKNETFNIIGGFIQSLTGLFRSKDAKSQKTAQKS